MAFAVTLYTLNKRENSTAHPAAGSGATFPCVLKKGCGILSPVIQLDIGLIEDPAIYNFAFIKTFDRYYWVDEWINEGPLWTASLRVDPLASWRSHIGNSSLYVLRSAAAYDGSIIDNKYPCKTGSLVYRDSVQSPWIHTSGTENIALGDGTFIVGVNGVSQGNGYGGVVYYALTRTGIFNLCDKLMDSEFLGDLGFSLNDASFELQKSLINPIDYIRSCIWLPVIGISHSAANVYLNGWEIPVGSGNAGVITNNPPYLNYTIHFDIRKHPYTNERGLYLNCAPYTRITIDLPPFPLIEIDTTLSCDVSDIYIDITIDLITGLGIARARAGANGLMSKVSAQIGVPIQLSQVTRDYIGGAISAASGIASLFSAIANPVSGLLGAAAGVGSAAQALAPKISNTGSGGGFSDLRGNAKMVTQFMLPVSDDPDHNGRPLCQIRQLSSLPGYQLIQDGDIKAPATGPELQAIKQYLESGYYYE